MKKLLLSALLVPPALAALTYFPLRNGPATFHSAAERAVFSRHNIQLLHDPGKQIEIDSNVLFLTSKACNGCHGYDPLKHALVTTQGQDVNIYDDWRSTMMANSARDPFWRAKVSQEILINPAHSLALQDKCTSCHAPAGHYQAKLHDHQEYYTLEEVYTDSLGLDGVTCQACHAQALDKLGSLHSGQLNFDTNHIRVAYGPYEIVFAQPMQNFVGVTPLFGEQISDAGVCAGCHTLLTESVDLQGNPTGSTFVEQATYHEWLNSRYDKTKDNISCQKCHVPPLQDEVIIAANYLFLTPKSPFGLHELAGANVSMLQLMKENRQQLEIPAEAQHFDSTIAATLRLLQKQTLDVSLAASDVNGDTLQFDLVLKNKAGHKFPSGYPSRRAWVEFEIWDESGQTVFHSGKMNADFSLADENPDGEPHYDIIRSEDQVQIYELVPGDVNGVFTTILERAHTTLKDNRLPPQGFTTSDPVYDTTRIVLSGNDPDFNFGAGGSEGSGADVLHFRIPGNGYTGKWNLRARVWYQSLPPKWMAPLFDYSTPEIENFKTMYNGADLSPVLVAETALNDVNISAVGTKNPEGAGSVRITPSLSSDGQCRISSENGVPLQSLRIWDAQGKMCLEKHLDGFETRLSLPQENGVYFVEVKTTRGRVVQKVVRQKP